MERKPSGAAVGFTMFAAVMMMMVGAFHAMAGFVGILEDDLYAKVSDYVLKLDSTTWGWIHLLAGLLILLAGFSVLAGKVWARTLGVILAVGSAVANFAWLPYYPVWSMVIIALDVFVIWALTVHGRDVVNDR